MTNDRYQGWTNRETWTAHAIIQNDPVLLKAFAGSNAFDLAKDFERFASTDALLAVGSLWRVDWAQLSKSLEPKS